jgi:hypothetical protein
MKGFFMPRGSIPAILHINTKYGFLGHFEAHFSTYRAKWRMAAARRGGFLFLAQTAYI